ncbi:hypothetical protein KI387_016406, partial [Taxus chinensis]
LVSKYLGVFDINVAHMDLEDLKNQILRGLREPVGDKIFTSGLYIVGGHLMSVKSIELVLACGHHYELESRIIMEEDNSILAVLTLK